MARDSGELTPKQLRFVDEYLIDLNATAAYKRAGYSAKDDPSAAAAACTMLKLPKVARAVRQGINAKVARSKVKQDRVLYELACIALLDPGEVMDFDGDEPVLLPARDIPEHARRAISSIRFKDGHLSEIKFWDKNVAIDKFMRHLGLYQKDNAQTTPTVPTPSLLDGLELAPEIRNGLLEAWRKKKALTNGTTK